MSTHDTLRIDVEAVVKNKMPQLGKRLPRFVYRLLERLICQDKLNYFSARSSHLLGVDFAEGLLTDMDVHIIMEGEENIPSEGRFIFASNHPLGGLDGIALIKLFGKKYNKQVRFLVNDLLMHVTNLAPVFIPINMYGNQDRSFAEKVSAEFNSDNQILIFPAGLCSRLDHGQVKDVDWKKSVIAKSIESQRDVIPIFFEGKNSSFFYKLAYWRKKLGIKFNIEMALLPREMIANNHKTFVVRIGKPIPWQTFDKSKSQKSWAAYLKNKAYELQH